MNFYIIKETFGTLILLLFPNSVKVHQVRQIIPFNLRKKKKKYKSNFNKNLSIFVKFDAFFPFFLVFSNLFECFKIDSKFSNLPFLTAGNPLGHSRKE